jgi:hypothetical protein
MKDFRSLKVWEKAHLLTLKIYKVTEKFRREELYGLTSQIRRACVSIPTNISEDVSEVPMQIFQDSFILLLDQLVN